MRVTMPSTQARPHETDLLLCGHHYRASRAALAAAHAMVRALPGTSPDVAAWIGAESPAAVVITVHARVKDVMTTNVVAVRSDASHREMAALLRAHRISGLPVVDAGGIVVGVVSESDLLTTRAGDGRPGWLPRRKHVATGKLTAADLMTEPAVTTSPDELVSSVARLMSERRLRRLPVVDRRGRLVGIVCRSDVLSVFSRPDEEIRCEITQDVILDGFFTDPDRLTVTVKDGIVTLGGAPGSAVLGRNIADQVRHVEGVVAVRDRFTYPLAGPAGSTS